MIRRLELLNLALLALLVALAIAVFPALPERIPTHFNVRGEADAWSATSAWTWFLLPAIALLTTVLMLVVSRVTAGRPEWVNLPSKEQFLELPAEEQRPIVRQVQLLVLGSNLLMLVMFGAIQWATYRTAQQLPSGGLLLVVLLIAVVLMPGLALSAVVRASRAVTAAHQRARQQGRLRPRVHRR